MRLIARVRRVLEAPGCPVSRFRPRTHALDGLYTLYNRFGDFNFSSQNYDFQKFQKILGKSMVWRSCLLIHGSVLLVVRRSARGPARPREGRGVALRVSRRPGATQWLPWGRGEHTREPWRALGGPGVDLQKRERIPKKCWIFGWYGSQLRDRSHMMT